MILKKILYKPKSFFSTLVSLLFFNHKHFFKSQFKNRQSNEKFKKLIKLHKLNKTSGSQLICDSCYKCAEICPVNCIEIKGDSTKKQNPSFFSIDYGACTFCNLCVEICPIDAISVGEKNFESPILNRESLVVQLVSRK